jgi:hypothetical protein
MLYRSPTVYCIAETAVAEKALRADGWHNSPACTAKACVCEQAQVEKTVSAPSYGKTEKEEPSVTPPVTPPVTHKKTT